MTHIHRIIQHTFSITAMSVVHGLKQQLKDMKNYQDEMNDTTTSRIGIELKCFYIALNHDNIVKSIVSSSSSSRKQKSLSLSSSSVATTGIAATTATTTSTLKKIKNVWQCSNYIVMSTTLS